jgi:hypothetical protein
MKKITKGLTLETLPKAFKYPTTEVSEMKRLLKEKSNEQLTKTERWFELNNLCNYLPDKPIKRIFYSWVNGGIISNQKSGKKLRFLKSEFNSWLQQGRKKTFSETTCEGEQYCKTKKG